MTQGRSPHPILKTIQEDKVFLGWQNIQGHLLAVGSSVGWEGAGGLLCTVGRGLSLSLFLPQHDTHKPSQVLLEPMSVSGFLMGDVQGLSFASGMVEVCGMCVWWVFEGVSLRSQHPGRLEKSLLVPPSLQ